MHHGPIVLSKNWESECSNHGKLITLFRLNPHLRILGYNSWEIENKLRIENTNRINAYKFNYGISSELVRYTNDTYQKRFFGGKLNEITYNTDISLVKYGLFGQVSRNFLANDLIISLGLRMDGNSYSAEMQNPLNQFSPRISASYNLSQNFSINANAGRF